MQGLTDNTNIDREIRTYDFTMLSKTVSLLLSTEVKSSKNVLHLSLKFFVVIGRLHDNQLNVGYSARIKHKIHQNLY